MKTPIYDFVKKYTESDFSRFHMPGHKGQSFLGCEKSDITEISGADVLYSAEGIIAQSENNATSLFGTCHTFYSTEGSTLAIKAMLALVGGEKPLILAARNVHKAFVYACALLDYDVEWIYSENASHLCSCDITPETVQKSLRACGKKPSAVYITSPDYLGRIADVRGISEVCRAEGIPLLVDNAHGAYLAFTEPSLHPIALGAAMCCDSAHKTLPVLTGGAYLHISKDYPGFAESAVDKLSLFASTSPSYLILQSLDLCNGYLADAYASRLNECIETVEQIKAFIGNKGFYCEACEPLKIVINASKSGYSGCELADVLRRYNIEAEYSDGEFLVLMVTPENSQNDFERLKKAFSSLEIRASVCAEVSALSAPLISKMSIRKAVFAPHERVETRAALDRVCASPSVSCPPAVPIAVSGEVITEEAIELFLHYGIDEIDVVK